MNRWDDPLLNFLLLSYKISLSGLLIFFVQLLICLSCGTTGINIKSMRNANQEIQTLTTHSNVYLQTISLSVLTFKIVIIKNVLSLHRCRIATMFLTTKTGKSPQLTGDHASAAQFLCLYLGAGLSVLLCSTHALGYQKMHRESNCGSTVVCFSESHMFFSCFDFTVLRLEFLL